jgi:CHAD domain-containing protein
LKNIRKYYRSRYNLLLSSLEVYYPYPDPEILHNIRVELKKIRSLFNYLRYANENFSVKNEYRSFKKIFKEAGKIRELHLILKLIQKYKIRIADEELYYAQENRLSCEFRSGIEIFKKDLNSANHIAEKYISKSDTGKLSGYLLIRQLMLQKLLTQVPDQTGLHDIRKVIKDLVYLSEILFGKLNNIESIYDGIQNSIGKWHDKQVLIGFLQGKYSESHRKIIQNIISSCIEDENKIHGLISEIQHREFIQVK